MYPMRNSLAEPVRARSNAVLNKHLAVAMAEVIAVLNADIAGLFNGVSRTIDKQLRFVESNWVQGGDQGRFWRLRRTTADPVDAGGADGAVR